MNVERYAPIRVTLNKIQVQKMMRYRIKHGMTMQEVLRRAVDAFFKIEYNKDV